MTREGRCKGLVFALALMGTLAPAVLSPVDAEAQTENPDGSITYPACSKEATPDDVEGAKGAHKAASQFFERGDYDRAIQYWNDAYGFDCSKPALLLNIANAYEKKGNKRATISILVEYLARAPESPDAGTIQAKIDNLKQNLEEAPPPAPTTTATAEPTATAPPPPVEMERPFGVAPWIVAGAGVAMAVPGIVLFIVGQGKVSDAESVCPDPANCEDPAARDLGNEGNTLSLVGSILGWGGLAVVAGGLVWQFAFNGPEPVTQAKITIVPAVQPTERGAQGGVLVTGSF